MARKAELWGGLFWLALGAFVVWQGLDLGLGTLHEPGSGFMVFWCGLLIVGFSLAITGGAMLQAQGATLASLWTGTRWGKILLVTAMIVLYALLFEQLGFIVC